MECTQTRIRSAKRCVARVFLAFLAFVLIQGLGTELYALALSQLELPEGGIRLLFTAGSLVFTALLAFPLFCRVMGEPLSTALGRLKGRAEAGAALGCDLLLTLGAASLAVAAMCGCALLGVLDPGSLAPGSGAELAGLILQSILVMPLLEELIFRGVVIGALRPFGSRTALLCSTACFALGHLNPLNLLIALPLGFLFGQVALRTGNVRTTVALHVTANLYGGLLAPLALAYGGGGVLWLLLSLSVLLVAVSASILYHQQRGAQ